MASSSDGGSGPKTAVVWFRRDLRLSDHRALADAVRNHERVVPLFVWDPALTDTSGPARLRFVIGCVEALAADLGGELVVRRGDPVKVVARVAREVRAEAVYISSDFGPYGTGRDEAVEKKLAGAGVALRRADTPYAVAPGTIENSGGQPFQVFTPFFRAWRSHGWDEPIRRPKLDRVTSAGLTSDRSPATPKVDADLLEPGEAAAHKRLDRFVHGPVDDYGRLRDQPGLDATSRLSAYLHFGCVHPRQILSRIDPSKSSHERFETELCWREFYADVLFHRPDAARQSYRTEWRRFHTDQGKDADERFWAWAEGRTGYPIVDAGMRQLLGEGWMHNRVRMIVASFLVKDLHLDWRLGARWFMQHLIDGDIASNQMNWQWVAGCGTDPAPYFRIFNPVTQGKKFDPDGDYIRRWVPELAGVAKDVIHEPWTAERSLLDEGPGDYPDPIVDHAAERQESLARYGRLRDSQ